MVADADLPVWTIKPNWANGIRETLSWLTDVLASTYGPEQRRALRLSPRREFEMVFNPIDAVRSYFDLWLHRMGSFEFMVPLFHDAGRFTAAIAGGATAIPFDTTYREFNAGDLAIIIGDDPFTFDKVAITAVGPSGITVAAGGVTRAWPKGTRIHPLRRSRISDESQASALTSRVGEATLQFQLNQANDLPDESTWTTLYGGHPIILDPPNRRESLDLTFNRNSLLLDNDLGLRVLNDDAGRAFTVQVDNRMMVGRAEHWAFRQMLYRLRGQQGTVWLPSFNRDIELSQDSLATDSYLNVKKIGYAYTGGVIDGRQHILIDGSYPVQVDGLGAEPSPAEEHLNLLAAAGTPFAAGTFGSFMDTCRLASDDIEIMHHTDTDGAAECNLSFKSFRDERTIPDAISSSIPVATQLSTLCGAPAAEEAGCVPTFETGFWAKILVDSSLGPNIPVIGPWAWQFSFWRGGVFQARMYSSDNYTIFDGGGPDPWTLPYNYLQGWTSYFYDGPTAIAHGEHDWVTDPFIDGPPDLLKVEVIQWPYNNYIFPGGSVFGDGLGSMSINLQLVGTGEIINFGVIPIFGLWPASYDLPAL
jgi:hypothetical protein